MKTKYVCFFLYLNRLTSVSLAVTHELAHTHTHTHTHRHAHVHTQRVRKEGTMLSCPPPSSKDVGLFFFLPLSQTSWEGYTALCVRRHSLFIFASLILPFFLIHGAQRARERVRRSLSPGQGGPRRGPGHKRAGPQSGRAGGRRRKDEITRQKEGDASVFLCSHVLCPFLLVVVLPRMTGGCLGRESGCLV